MGCHKCNNYIFGFSQIEVNPEEIVELLLDEIVFFKEKLKTSFCKSKSFEVKKMFNVEVLQPE